MSSAQNYSIVYPFHTFILCFYGVLWVFTTFKASTQKWQKTERNFSSNFFAQKDLPGSEVFKNRKNFEKNWWEHGSFDFFFWFTYLHKKKNLCDNF